MNNDELLNPLEIEKSTTPVPLLLDLIGPFVVHFCQGTVRIHAPFCTDHHANILTDSNDIALWGLDAPANPDSRGYVYGFEDATAPTGACKYACEEQHKPLTMTFQMNPIDKGNCHLGLQVPFPNEIVGLLPDHIWMHRNGAKHWIDGSSDIVDCDCARGLRLIYRECARKPKLKVIEQPSSQPSGVPDFSNLESEVLGLRPRHYHITLRFVSNTPTPDLHHEDAYDCFQTMRTLIPEASKWRVDFDDTINPSVGSFESDPVMHLLIKGGPHPVDCGAPLLVVQDPV